MEEQVFAIQGSTAVQALWWSNDGDVVCGPPCGWVGPFATSICYIGLVPVAIVSP